MRIEKERKKSEREVNGGPSVYWKTKQEERRKKARNQVSQRPVHLRSGLFSRGLRTL